MTIFSTRCDALPVLLQEVFRHDLEGLSRTNPGTDWASRVSLPRLLPLLLPLFKGNYPFFFHCAPGPRPSQTKTPSHCCSRSTRRTISRLTPGHDCSSAPTRPMPFTAEVPNGLSASGGPATLDFAAFAVSSLVASAIISSDICRSARNSWSTRLLASISPREMEHEPR